MINDCRYFQKNTPPNLPTKIIFGFAISLLQILFSTVSHGDTHYKNNAPAFTIEEATISSIHTAIKNHRMTCEQLINAYLDRIKKYDLSMDNKPPINAITEINPSVIDQARLLDKIY